MLQTTADAPPASVNHPIFSFSLPPVDISGGAYVSRRRAGVTVNAAAHRWATRARSYFFNSRFSLYISTAARFVCDGSVARSAVSLGV